MIALDNGSLCAVVLPTRGMGISFLEFRETENNGYEQVRWDSPANGPVHPAFVNLEARNGLGWLEGFSELVCRCGLASNGPPGIDPDARSPIESALTLHGRIANLPATLVCAEINDVQQRVSLTGTVDEKTLFGPQLQLRSTVSSRFHSFAITIDDVVQNVASTPTDLQLLYHINVGTFALEDGAKLVMAADAIAPRDPRAAEGIDTFETCLGPTPGYSEQAYYFQPRGDRNGDATALLKNAAGDMAFAVSFNVRQLPKFVFWKCTQPRDDGYVVGLEPATNFPNFKAYERDQGRVISLGPGEKYATRVTLAVLKSAAEVAAVEAEITAIQGDRPPIIHRTPQPGWSPAGETR
jgi:hypothetical protein